MFTVAFVFKWPPLLQSIILSSTLPLGFQSTCNTRRILIERDSSLNEFTSVSQTGGGVGVLAIFAKESYELYWWYLFIMRRKLLKYLNTPGESEYHCLTKIPS
ncbi:hypothetical protein WA026_010984 [Henosepilachna vigintioctopunctata]|uniref:Uncharacterized protein n=1 Tax=Henosepilachna vigintioctopunctata TaxID=420089 RepID=A0AAW1UPR6_9CUCU